jgi:hypothetical protein
MAELSKVAPAFLEMAHRIVWCSVATINSENRPMSRVLHPIWEWDGDELVGWIATGPTPIKRAHLANSPYVSLNYWTPSQDTCTADCRATWMFDKETRTKIWNLLLHTPPPVGYDPKLIPAWTSPDVDAFAVLKLEPWRLRVFPGTVLLQQTGEVLTWRKEE